MFSIIDIELFGFQMMISIVFEYSNNIIKINVLLINSYQIINYEEDFILNYKTNFIYL